MSVEIWRPAVGFPNYEVSTFGGIRRIRYTDKRGHIREPREVDITPYGNPQLRAGKVRLFNGKQHTISLASVILRAFVGPPPVGKPNALHLDDNRLNNKLTNLYWGSQKDNTIDSVINGKQDLGRTEGTIWVTNGITNCRVKVIPDGWWLGRSGYSRKKRRARL